MLLPTTLHPHLSSSPVPFILALCLFPCTPHPLQRYTATDRSGNTAEATRAITVVDTTPPTIQFPKAAAVSRLGALQWNYGSRWRDDAFVITDNYDTKATLASIGYEVNGVAVVKGEGAASVDVTARLGTATTLTLTAQDAAGNRAERTVTVVIVAADESMTTSAPALDAAALRAAYVVSGDARRVYCLIGSR